MTACWRGDPARPPEAAVGAPKRQEVGNRGAPSLTPELVYETISTTYLSQIKRCYELAIRKNAGARGRVTLAFTIDTTGGVTDARADGVAPEITSCITRRMADWRFAPPPRTAGEFRIPLQLEAN